MNETKVLYPWLYGHPDEGGFLSRPPSGHSIVITVLSGPRMTDPHFALRHCDSLRILSIFRGYHSAIRQRYLYYLVSKVACFFFFLSNEKNPRI